MSQRESHFEQFISRDNFRLAWDRVRYFDRPDSRDWVGLRVFAANRDYNLNILREEVKSRVFEPSWPEVKYFPKPSLTLRPMAILSVRDRVVFQAIANVIANFGRSKLAIVSNRQSFANILSQPSEKSFFVPWKTQYKKFQRSFVDRVNEGDKWVVETDMAAFYETIDHQTLFKILLDENFLDERTLDYLRQYLPVWASVKRDVLPAKGIPQGNLASDLLANVFLYQFDKELSVQEYHYLRYVDDIRLLSNAKDIALKGLITVDTTLKSYGLLLQSKKTSIREIDDVESEADRMAALLSEIDMRFSRIPKLTEIDPLLDSSLHDVALIDDVGDVDSLDKIQDNLISLFWESLYELQKNSHAPFAERHIRFCLYRLQPVPDITDAVLPYFLDRPWMSEVIALYLQREKLGSSAINFLKNIITTHKVYDTVVALAIQILVRQGVSLRAEQSFLRKWVIKDNRHWTLLVVSVIALGESNNNMSVLLRALRSKSAMVRRMAVIQSLRVANNKDEAKYVASIAITDKDAGVIETLIYLMYNEWGISINDLEIDSDALSDYCLSYAKGYDASLPQIQIDYVRHVLKQRYHVVVNGNVDFKKLLGSEYERASHFLWQAEISYYPNPSRYVSQLDLFHEELLYPILVDILQVKNARDELAKVELTDRIKMLSSKEQDLAAFAGAIGACRKLRANPETHSRFHGELTYTSNVTWRQRDRLMRTLAGGYQQLVSWLESRNQR